MPNCKVFVLSVSIFTSGLTRLNSSLPTGVGITSPTPVLHLDDPHRSLPTPPHPALPLPTSPPPFRNNCTRGPSASPPPHPFGRGVEALNPAPTVTSPPTLSW